MLTTLICGPLENTSLQNIDIYKQYGDVIVSCYNTDNFDLLNYIDQDVKVVVGKLPPGANPNSGKVFYQAWSTYQALQYVKTEFVIRSRSDEQWGNLQPFIETMLSGPDKFTSCNIFFKGTSEPLHPSDHLYGGKTKYFKIGLKHFIEQFLSLGYAHGGFFGLEWLGALASGETPIFLSFLHGLGITHTIRPDNVNNITFDNTQLVNIDLLQPFIFAYNLSDGKHYDTTSDSIYGLYPSLKDMSEFWTLKYSL